MKSMLKNSKKIIVLLLVICIIGGLVSCKKATSTSTFVIGTTQSIEKAIYGEYNYDMLASGVSEMPLVCQNSDGSYAGLLCDYSTTDSQTWVYTVKEGMTWSDGVAVTADDILFTLQYEDSQGSANLVDQGTTQKKYESYTVSLDHKNISLTLVTANVRELANMTTFRIAPKHVLENNDNPTKEELRITCGPYVLESFDAANGTLTYSVNSYYPKKPHIDKIIYQIYANEDVMYTALNQGDIDMTWIYNQGVASSYLDILESNSQLSVVSVASTASPAVLAFNNSKGLGSDTNVRRAMAYALDYNVFKNTFGSKLASITKKGFVSSSTLGYTETENNSYNLELADSYMVQAGYTKESDGYYYKEGTKCCLNLTVNASKAAHIRYAEVVKTQLEDFGISVNLNELDSTAYNACTSNKFSNHNITMEAAIYGFTSAGMAMGSGLGTIYVDGNHNVQGGCQVFDSAFQTALSSLSNTKTLADYQEAAKVIQEYYASYVPMIALYQDSNNYVYNAKYRNLNIDLVFGLNNINNWFSIEA